MINVKWVGASFGNFSPGRRDSRTGNVRRVEVIVIHRMLGTLASTDTWFTIPPERRPPPSKGSSAHYGIGQSGTVHQYVKEHDRAYHAGYVKEPTWPGMNPTVTNPNPPFESINPNLFSVGIEHEGFSEDPWSVPMMSASAELVAGIAERWSIPLDRYHVIGHGELDSEKRNTCPGPQCDLDKLISMALQIRLNAADAEELTRDAG